MFCSGCCFPLGLGAGGVVVAGGLAIKPRNIKSFLTLNVVGIVGTDEVTGVEAVLGIDTFGILRIVEPSWELSCLDLLLLVEGFSFSDFSFLLGGSTMGGPGPSMLKPAGTLRSGRVTALKSACDLLCLTSNSSILF